MEFPRPQLENVPGNFKPVPQDENKIKDITKLTRLELLDLKKRQADLLCKKKSLNCLPDKGARVKILYDKAVEELERRDSILDAAALFSNLNLAERGTNALNELEWSSGKVNPEALAAADPMEDVLDSDDEQDMNPLRIIAQRRMHERKVKILPPERKLITEKDLEEINEYNASVKNVKVVNAESVEIDVATKLENLDLETASKKKGNNSTNFEIEPHVRYLVTKEEAPVANTREKYKPYQTTINDSHNPNNERNRKLGKHWENTAATPPPIKHRPAQSLSLLDSVEIQKQYIERLKLLHEQQATERLAAKMARSARNESIKVPSQEDVKKNITFSVYRNTQNIEGDLDLNEDDEVYDPADVEKGGGVNYSYSE